MENRKLEIPGLCGEKRIILRPFLFSQPSVQLLAIPDQILGPISAAKPWDLPYQRSVRAWPLLLKPYQVVGVSRPSRAGYGKLLNC
jgi:hypothetical protein